MIHYAGGIFDDAERAALREVADTMWLTAGPYAARFERDFATYLGVGHAMLCNSGSSANLLALTALTSRKLGDERLKPGDEVITTACAFPTTVAPIVQLGLTPVFVDVALGDYVPPRGAIENAVSEKTQAVMMAHTCGVPFNVDEARSTGLWVIGDSCDALGARWRGSHVANNADLTTYSFYVAHHITMGEGGAVVTSDSNLAAIVRSLRDWGRDCHCLPGENNKCGQRFSQQYGTLPLGYDHKYVYSELGYNLKVTEMQAAVGCAQLGKLDRFIAARNANHAFLLKALCRYEDRLIMPRPLPDCNPSWFAFTIAVRDGARFTRADLTGYLEAQGIETRPLFAGNVLHHPAFQGINYRIAGDLHNTEKAMSNAFFIGVWPGMTSDDLQQIVEAFDTFIRRA